MFSNTVKLGIGLLGASAVQVVDKSIPTDPDSINIIMQVITQILIGIATIWSLFRKKK